MILLMLIHAKASYDCYLSYYTVIEELKGSSPLVTNGVISVVHLYKKTDFLDSINFSTIIRSTQK